jgi:hypothetical protein
MATQTVTHARAGAARRITGCTARLARLIRRAGGRSARPAPGRPRRRRRVAPHPVRGDSESLIALPADQLLGTARRLFSSRGWGQLTYSQVHPGVGSLETADWAEVRGDGDAGPAIVSFHHRRARQPARPDRRCRSRRPGGRVQVARRPALPFPVRRRGRGLRRVRAAGRRRCADAALAQLR